MPPKKKDAKAAGAGDVEGEDPLVLKNNYEKFCKQIAISPNPDVKNILEDEEHYPVTQIVVCEPLSIENDFIVKGKGDQPGPLGPGGTRALCTAILGIEPGMQGGPYRLLNSIRIWKNSIGDDGAAAVAELLRLGGAEVKIEYLELIDNQISTRGALALGRSLSIGSNKSLQTLKLDYNSELGSDGIRALCRGLRTNSSLKQLHVPYCNIDEEGGGPLGEMVSNAQCQLHLLNLQGNPLGGKGLLDFCVGLSRNKSIQFLSIADNGISYEDEDIEALRAFAAILKTHEKLANVDMMYNRIGERGGEVLVPALGPDNVKIKTFLVDAVLPTPLFEALHRKETGGKKKGKKKKK